jgi:hypothetical protein
LLKRRLLRKIEAFPEKPGGDPMVQDLGACSCSVFLWPATKRVFSF